MEKKSFNYKVADLDETKGIVKIYVNAFNNVDHANEISMPGSFSKTLQENFKRLRHLKNHDRTMLLGLPLEAVEDNFGLMVTSKMNIEKQLVKDVFSDYVFFNEEGRTLEHSIGYDIVKWDYDQTTGIQRNYEYKLFEYSTLDFLGCNEKTPLIDIKSQNAEKLAESINLLEKMLKFTGYSDEKCKQIEQKITEIRQLYTKIEQPPLVPEADTITPEQAEAEKKKQYYLKLLT